MTVEASGAVIRGRFIDQDLISFGARSDGIEFMAPDPKRLMNTLPLKNPALLSDLYRLSMTDILDYLERLGGRLDIERNVHLQRAMEAANGTSNLTPPLIEASYRHLADYFDRQAILEIIERCLGLEYLEGWSCKQVRDGRTVSVRAFGARALHIIAGNAPMVAALTIVRNAITRSDAIVKCPSNDPYTALAIARTMIDLDSDHPLTRHLSVAYWKGGDESVERQLYRPEAIEKIIAWGGLASVRHVTQYIQPGLELITLDPKRSMSIVGAEALKNDALSRESALRLATDIGAHNQEACVNARVVFVQSGTDESGLALLNAFGEQVYAAMMNLPRSISTVPKALSRELRTHINTARLTDEWYRVIGGTRDEGAIIVSQLPEPVGFSSALAGRVANLVPFDEVDEIFAAIDAYTQTIGIFPENLKVQLRDRLPLYGAQRITSLGYAASAALAAPQDAIEPLRRMCKWIVEETCDPATCKPLWQ